MAMPKATRSSKLIDVVRNLRQGVHRSDVEAQVILENLGISASVLGKDRPAEEVLEEIVSGDKTLKKLINAASSYIRTQKKLDQLTKVNEHQAARLGRGALSSGQAWGASGWRLTPTGFSWQRPPNVRATESFTSTPSTHIAKYNAITLTKGYSDQTTVVPYDPRFALQQNALEALNGTIRQQQANTLWASIRNLRDGFGFGGRRYKPWTDWQVEVFDFAKSHGFGTGASGLRDAETILKQKAKNRGAKNLSRMRSLRNYQRHLLRMTPHERERHELIMQYGGGPEGIALADEALRRRRDERVKLDQMTDYQRERHELVERYGGGAEGESLADAEMNRRADRRHRLAESRASIRRKAERIDLAKRYPAFKRFFLDSRNSTKDIHAMAGYLKGMSKIPVVGGILKANPIAAGSLAAIAAINVLLNKQNAANLAATNWENAASFFGTPSKEFEVAARLAGIKDPAKIASIYGQYTKWGLDPAEMMREIGAQTIGRTPFEKRSIAEAYSKSLGVSLGADEIKLAEYLAGDTNISEARKVSAKLGLLETEEQFGFRSGSSLIEKLRSLSLWAPWAKDIEARTGINYVSAGGKYLNLMTAPMFTGYDVADLISAAIADDKYDSDAARNSSPSLPQSLTGSTSNWYGVTIVSDAKSIDELAKDAQRHADAKDERLRAATSQDPGAQ